MQTRLFVPTLLAALFISYSTFGQQAAPSIIWQKCLGGSKNDQAKAMTRTLDNGFLIVGSSYSNDGDVAGHHGATDKSDGWVVKLSSSGTVEWQLSLGGSDNDELDAVTRTSDGGYVCLGTTYSSDGDIAGFHGVGGYRDLWVVKISRWGQLLWSRVYGGSNDEMAGNIRENRDGSYYVIGSTMSGDGDVSGFHGPIPGYFPTYDIWVLKLNSAGSILWQSCIGGNTGADKGYDICEDAAGTSFIMTVALGSDNGDIPDPKADMYAPNGLVVKMDSTKSLKWMVHTSNKTPWQVTPGAGGMYYVNANGGYCYPANSQSSYQYGILDDPLSPPTDNSQMGLGGIFFCPNALSYFAGYIDFGPHGLAPLTASNLIVSCGSDDTVSNAGRGWHGGAEDGFVYSLTPVGIINWKKFYGGSGIDALNNIFPISETEYIACGFTNSNDGDVSGNHGGSDFWVIKLGMVNHIKGTVFEDYNSNGARDAGEPLVSNIQVQSARGSELSSSLTYNGEFLNSVDTGTFTTTVLTGLPYYTSYPASYSNSFSTFNNTDSVSFALQPIPGKRDYSVHIYALTPARPGFQTAYEIDYLNEGTDTLTNRPVKFIKDSRLQFLSATPAQTSVSGDTITWNIASLPPRAEGTITIQLQVPAPPAVTITGSLLSLAVIDSTGDLNPFNNLAKLYNTVTGSFDPNGKEEANGGKISIDDLQKGKELLYTIHFQNTGTDTAFTVIVRDTLSDKLDPSTLQMTGASHPYQLSILNGNELTWTFSNILLPDSTKNLQGSQGFASFRVKPKSSVTAGDSVLNTAAIYFDYNLPVATNTQKTMVDNAVTLPNPPAPAISGLQTSYCPKEGVQTIKIINIPAPSYQATVTVKVDGNAVTVASDSSFTLRPDTLAGGAHTLTVVFSNATGADTAAWPFRVGVMVTPVVNLGSNITNVVNLSQQVVVTATNTAGGGISPLYTFAKDRGFTSILQAEGSLNILTLDPATLQVGDNKLFVRMRTSDTCYVTPTGVDSIFIVRSPVTGLVDIDYPGQVINIDPNPFSSRVYITGLQPAKAYSISLLNSNGQTIARKRVVSQQETVLDAGVLAKGIYLLRVYDQKKNRLIGSAKLLSAGY